MLLKLVKFLSRKSVTRSVKLRGEVFSTPKISPLVNLIKLRSNRGVSKVLNTHIVGIRFAAQGELFLKRTASDIPEQPAVPDSKLEKSTSNTLNTTSGTSSCSPIGVVHSGYLRAVNLNGEFFSKAKISLEIKLKSSKGVSKILNRTNGIALAAQGAPISDRTLVNLPDIPEPPAVPISALEEVTTEILNAAGEPSFASIGLGGWSPIGIVQNCMEYLHCDCGIPWWGAIAAGTLFVRVIIFPLVLVSQRNAAKMNNYMPEMQKLQLKMSEARQTGNALESARYAQEMMVFMKEKGLNPLKNMVVPLAQAPLFISFFMGLREMANTPVESMRDGGLFWFKDLTLADPTFLLPIITSATLMLTIELGTDSARLNAQNMGMLKYVLRALPIAIFPFTMNFPAGILTYWACSNFISLGQVAILKVPAVREYFKIEKMVTHKAENLPVKKKGFVDGMKDSWQNMKITRELEERQRLDEIRFARAGKGPLIKTYKYDPTKPKPNVTPNTNPPVEAKKSN